MNWLHILTSFIVLLVSADAAAQCAGGVPDGELDPGNLCSLCRDGDFEPLPPRTACGTERRVQCDAMGAFRVECVASVADPSVTTCETNYRWAACPSGLQCDAGFCLQTCTSDAQCQPNFECRADTCVAVDPPDMGADMSVPDMGQPVDMEQMPDSGPVDTGTPPRPDAGPDADLGSVVDLGVRPKTKPSDSGCCAVATPPGVNPWFIGLLVVGILWMRRRCA